MWFREDPLGQVHTTVSAPGAAAVNNGGILFDPSGSMHVNLLGSATDVYIGGVRCTFDGRVVRADPAGVYDYNSGIPTSREVDLEGAMVRTGDIAPPAGSTAINGGVLVGPTTEGVLWTSAPVPFGAQQLVNPDFTSNVSGWVGANANLAWLAGVCVVTGTAGPGSNLIGQLLPPQAVQIGWTYRCEARIRNVTSSSGPRLRIARGAPGGNAILVGSAFIPGTTFTDVSLDFVPRFSDLDITVQATAAGAGEIFEVEYCRLWLLGL